MASGLLSKEVETSYGSTMTIYTFSHEDHAEVFCDNVQDELCGPLGDWARQRGCKVWVMRCRAID